jgi:hypothetical protein
MLLVMAMDRTVAGASCQFCINLHQLREGKERGVAVFAVVQESRHGYLGAVSFGPELKVAAL